MKLFNNLVMERLKMGLTQEQVAKKIGISQSTLSMIESGSRSGKDSTKAKLSKLYGKTVDYLFFEDKFTKRD